jgi:hypothetical protein
MLTRFRYGVAISLVLLAALIALGFGEAIMGHADARLIQGIRLVFAPGAMMLCALLLILNVAASRKIKHSI